MCSFTGLGFLKHLLMPLYIFIHNILKLWRHLGTNWHVQNIAIAINFVISVHVKLMFYQYSLGDSKTSLIFLII